MLEPIEVVLPESPCLVMHRCRKERVKVQSKADKEDQGSSLQNLKIGLGSGFLIFRERECHGATHAEHEERVNKIRRSASYPSGMP